MTISELDFSLPLQVTVAVDPFEGIVLSAAGDPLRAQGAFVRYTIDDAVHFGYILTRLASDVRGRRWGMGLLYDVDPTASDDLPLPNQALDARFRQHAEVEFIYA